MYRKIKISNRTYNDLKKDLDNYSKKKLFQYLKKDTRSFQNSTEMINIIPNTNLKIELNWSVTSLTYHKYEIKKFIELEKKLFNNIFNGNYDICLLLLDQIDSELSFSLWSILIRMSILYLKKDLTTLDSFSNEIKEDIEQLVGLDQIKETIHLHQKKLQYLNQQFSFEQTKSMVYNNLYEYMNYRIIAGWEESDDEIRQINEERLKNKESSTDELLLSSVSEIFTYNEKYVLSPFNKKSSQIDLSNFLFQNSLISYIDLYKSFTQVYSELNSDHYKFDNYLLTDIQEFLNDKNIIKNINFKKITEIANIIDYKTIKLYLIFEYFLNGEFDKVIILSLKVLKKYPFYVDYIYLLVASIVYSEKEINSINSYFRKDSLISEIIYTLHNIFTNNNLNNNLNKIKSILLIFGIHCHWNMFLYYMIKDFMCQNTDTKNLSYSHSLLYSYLNHPRLFFVLEDKQKQLIIKYMKEKKQEKYTTFKVFSSSMNQNNSELEIKPYFRTQYLEAINKSLNSNELLKLYSDVNNKPFIHEIKIIVLYVNTLIKEEKYIDALKIIIENYHNRSIPICMYNYLPILSENETCNNLPHFVLLLIYHNHNDYIKIYYALKHYLDSFENDYSRPSLLAKNLQKDDINLNLQVELLKLVSTNNILEEFILQFNCKSDILNEQITILSSLKNFSKDSSDLEKKINVLNIELKKIKNNHEINHGRLEIKLSLEDKYITEISNKFNIEAFNKMPRWEKSTDIYWEFNNNVYQEDTIIELTRNIIIKIFTDKDGLKDQIEGRIKHTFFHEAIKKPLQDSELITKLDEDNTTHIPIKKWPEYIQKQLFDFTDKINQKIKDFKENQLNIDELKSNYYDFSLKNLYSKESIISIIDYYHEQKNFDITYLLNDIVIKINEELEKYSKKIKDELNRIFLSEIRNLQTIVKETNKDNSNLTDTIVLTLKTMEDSFKEISSWLKLKKLTREKEYSLINLLEILSNEFSSLIDFSKIECKEDKILFTPASFHHFLYIFHNIFSNISRHGNLNKKVLISIDEIDNEYFNIFVKNAHKNHFNEIIENTGMKVIRASLESINYSNTLNYNFNRTEFIYTLKLKKEGLIYG